MEESIGIPERDRVIALSTVPVMAYHDEAMREHLWGRLRESCAYIANRDRPGWVLDENDAGSRMVQFARFVEAGGMDEADDEPIMVLFPCSEDEAEMVYMRLTCWSVAPLEETSPKE